MRVGLNLPNYGDLGTRDAVGTIADAAEGLGFASLWTTDHVLLPSRLPEPYGRLLETLTTLSYLAARTERIGLATSVLVLPQRDPLLVAKQAATIQHLSGGRLTLGVGVGWVEEEYRYLRADFRRRGRLADEYIAAMRELFEADLPSFKGSSIEYDDVLFSPRPEAPLPIVVGGASKAALTRAATLGDGWHGIHLTTVQVRRITEALRAERLRPGFEISLRMKVRLDGEIEGAEPGTVLAGSVESVVEGVRAYEAAGVDQLVIEPAADRLPDLLDQLSAFAREVLPAVTQGAQS